MVSKVKNFLLGAVLLHLLWFAGHFLIDYRLIPSPLRVYTSMDGSFWLNMLPHIGHSLWRLVLALFISLVIGLVIGLFSANSKVIGKLLNPLIYFLYPIPKMAFLPVVMVLFEIGNAAIIVMIILIISLQLVINVRDGINSIPAENYQILQVLGASRWELFKNVTLPAALGQILSGARVALGTATAILFITETTGTRYGVGFFIMSASNVLNYVNMFAGIVVLSLVSLFLFFIIDRLAAIFLRWNK